MIGCNIASILASCILILKIFEIAKKSTMRAKTADEAVYAFAAIRELEKEELGFGYRASVIKDRGYVVLGAELMLVPGDKEEILARMQELKNKRVEKQPLEYPSAGSAFKRPEGYFAGKLVMDAGLSGYAVGGAKVSEKHCGFLINAGGATASDVMELIRQIQAKVKEQFGVQLEPEIQFLGEF